MKFGSSPEEALKYQKTYFYLKDRVLQICGVLQQITAHQDDIYSRDGVGARIKLTPRRQLEGFDFMDVATNQGTLWPKVNYIHALGEGWVDFTRELHCVALFGTGFGELMKPVGKPCRHCMSNIPQGPDLLGVTVADLLDIIKRKGNDNRSPWRVEDIHWYIPDKLFEPCRCGPTHITRRDRVQVFLPVKHPKLWGRDLRSPQLAAGGAILVGHSFKYPLRWGNRREPEKGEPGISVENNHTPFHDSGIGSSNASESAEDSRSARYLQPARSPPGRPDPHEVGFSDSGIYLHVNQQFVHLGNSPQSVLEEHVETSTLTSASNTGLRSTDGSTGEKRSKLRFRK